MKKKQGPATERILEVWLQPRSSRNEIVGFQDGVLRIRVTAPPKEGEANHMLRKILADTLRIPISGVEIVAGQTARRKRVRVMNVTPENLEALARSE
jgi:uncharacterized protein